MGFMSFFFLLSKFSVFLIFLSCFCGFAAAEAGVPSFEAAFPEATGPVAFPVEFAWAGAFGEAFGEAAGTLAGAFFADWSVLAAAAGVDETVASLSVVFGAVFFFDATSLEAAALAAEFGTASAMLPWGVSVGADDMSRAAAWTEALAPCSVPLPADITEPPALTGPDLAGGGEFEALAGSWVLPAAGETAKSVAPSVASMM